MMKTKLLFPHSYKKIGWILFLPTILLGAFVWIADYDLHEMLTIKVFAIINEGFIDGSNPNFSFIENGILDEILSLFIIVGGILVGFSKEKQEDEFIASLRTSSLVWATYINYGILLLAILFVYGLAFFDVLVFNMFTMLLFFIIRFHFVLYQTKKSLNHEE